jgi:hypothetical protein
MCIQKTIAKLKTYKDIKISLTAYCAKLVIKKFGPWPNSCVT